MEHIKQPYPEVEVQNRKPALAYYITPHGFGHGVRSCEILRRLLDLKPDLKAIIISDLPEFFIEQNIGRRVEVRRLRLDVGLYQYDGIRFDLERTLTILNRIHADSELIIRDEEHFLKENGIDVVISDIASLPFEAACRCGIPSIGISNFTWDWIYQAYANVDPRWNKIIEWIREGYSKGDLFLQLPMNGDCSAFRSIVEVPLVARQAVRARNEVRSALGVAAEEPVILVSFTGLDLEEKALGNIRKIRGITFIYKSPLKFPVEGAVAIDGADLSYTDAVAAADAVITKPGYGIVSDCLASGASLIYTERGLFPEYEILVKAIQENLNSVFIDSRDFAAGNWEASIRSILSQPRKMPVMRTDGADVCAGKILEFINGRRSRIP